MLVANAVAISARLRENRKTQALWWMVELGRSALTAAGSWWKNDKKSPVEVPGQPSPSLQAVGRAYRGPEDPLVGQPLGPFHLSVLCVVEPTLVRQSCGVGVPSLSWNPWGRCGCQNEPCQASPRHMRPRWTSKEERRENIKVLARPKKLI